MLRQLAALALALALGLLSPLGEAVASDPGESAAGVSFQTPPAEDAFWTILSAPDAGHCCAATSSAAGETQIAQRPALPTVTRRKAVQKLKACCAG